MFAVLCLSQGKCQRWRRRLVLNTTGQNAKDQGQTGSSAYAIAIVGGGIVGLATARTLLQREPHLRLIVLEKESAIARHQSGHNSGVIHTGIYYAPSSLKAQACVAGHDAIIEFCREKDIPFDLCGKVIVALDESELPRLNELFSAAQPTAFRD